jgi:hypothetical protein
MNQADTILGLNAEEGFLVVIKTSTKISVIDVRDVPSDLTVQAFNQHLEFKEGKSERKTANIVFDRDSGIQLYEANGEGRMVESTRICLGQEADKIKEQCNRIFNSMSISLDEAKYYGIFVFSIIFGWNEVTPDTLDIWQQLKDGTLRKLEFQETRKIIQQIKLVSKQRNDWYT